MKQIIIREAVCADANAIFMLNKRELGYEYSIEGTSQKLTALLSREDHKIFVAIFDKKVVGYVHANDYDVLYAPHMKNIMGIAVLSGFKRMGIGKAMLASVEEWAKKTGACGIRLVSGITRIGAHEFYRHCGYDGGKQQVNFRKLF